MARKPTPPSAKDLLPPQWIAPPSTPPVPADTAANLVPAMFINACHPMCEDGIRRAITQSLQLVHDAPDPRAAALDLLVQWKGVVLR